MEDKDIKCRKLPVVRAQKTEYSPMKEENGVLSFGYPVYGKDVREWLAAFGELDLADRNYIENCAKIGDKDISEMTRDEVLTVMTRIVRGERFCDGTIAKAAESGELEALGLRLREVTGGGL